MLRKLQVRAPWECGLMILNGTWLLKPAGGSTLERGYAHAFFVPQPEERAPRWLIWHAGPGEYWNNRPGEDGSIEGIRVQ